MDKKKYLKFLNKFKGYKNKSTEYQLLDEEEIIELFKQFWDNQPTEKQFDECLNSIIIFPRIQYYMIQKGLDKK